MAKHLVMIWNLYLKHSYVETVDTFYNLFVMVLKDYHVTFQDSVLVAVQQLPIQEPPYWLGQQYVF